MESNLGKVLPLYLAPSIDWFLEAILNEKILIGEETIFSKQTYRNRIQYGTFQGVKIFSIPVIHSTVSDSYRNVKISYATNWQNQLVNALKTSYGKSPFFEFYGYRFESIILRDYELLWDLNWAILLDLFHCLKMEINIEIIKCEVIDRSFERHVSPYYQVFHEKLEFIPHLSVLDLIFNEGPDALTILQKISKVNI